MQACPYLQGRRHEVGCQLAVAGQAPYEALRQHHSLRRARVARDASTARWQLRTAKRAQLLRLTPHRKPAGAVSTPIQVLNTRPAGTPTL